MSPVAYTDRRLAVTPHAVLRFRERTSACGALMDDDEIRHLLAGGYAQAIELGELEVHYVPMQTRFRVPVPGRTRHVFAVVGKDDTGWSASGTAIITVLTPEQIATSRRD